MFSKTMSYGYSNVMGQYFDTISFRRFVSSNLNKVKTFVGNKNIIDIFNCVKEKQ